MKFEIKLILLSLVFSFLCMLSFTYACSFAEKKMYVNQVGIYKEETNKDQKLAELKQQSIEGYVYSKDNQFYVLSIISDNYDEVVKHNQSVKGIIKEYIVSSDTNNELLLNSLRNGQIHD